MLKSKSFLYLVFSALTIINLQGNENMETTTDICELDPIYSNQFTFSLPRTELEKQLSGIAFDHKEPYTKKELEDLCADINNLYLKILDENPVQEKVAVMTAGAPGAGKTFKIKQDRLAEQESTGKVFAYTDPDDVCLKNMSRTYQVDIQCGEESFEIRKAAYDKWRSGSNAANNLFLANLIHAGYGFYFGTTATSPYTWIFFEFLKNQGYEIRLIHVSAPDDVRWASIKERDKEFVQTTEKDTAEKGLLFPQRIADTYLKYADQIDFYYRDGVHKDAELAATWKKKDRNLEIHDPSAYQEIKALHNQMVEELGEPRLDLKWEVTVEAN